MHSVACLTLLVTSLTIAACNIGSGTQEPVAVTEEEREPIPPSVTSLVTRAQMASAEGKHSAGLRFADEAIRRVPTFGRAHFVRGEILTALGRLEDARNAYEVVRQIDPAFPFINIRLGGNAVSRRQFKEALMHYQAAELLLQEDAPLETRRDLIMQIGNVQRELGRADSALSAYRAVLGLDTEYGPGHDAMGTVYQEEGELELALEARERALALMPDDGQYAYRLGEVLYLLGRPEEAVPYLEQAVSRLPWFPGAHYNLGRSLIALGKTGEGGQYVAAADSLRVRMADLGLARARAEAHNTSGVWTDYANMLAEDKRLDEALQSYLTAIALDPNNEAASRAIQDIRAQGEF